MKNNVKTFTMFVCPDEKSFRIANAIRELNSKVTKPLEETEDGDLVIAIGGDGTFIDAVTNTQFSKEKIYTGIHTGTVGFLQDLSENDIYSLIQYINYEKKLKTRRVYVALTEIFLKNGEIVKLLAFNEVIIAGENYSKISFAEYINGELLQNVTGNGIIITTSAGDTAYSMNADGAIDLSKNFQLICTLKRAMKYAVYERFMANSIICSEINIVLKPTNNICIIIDGIKRDIDSGMIENVTVSTIKDSNYINKLDLVNYSKVRVIRNKILGY